MMANSAHSPLPFNFHRLLLFPGDLGPQVAAKLQSLDHDYKEGWTNMSGGLYYAREYLFTKDEVHDRSAVHDLIILFTDGESNMAIPGSDAINEGNLNHAAGTFV